MLGMYLNVLANMRVNVVVAANLTKDMYERGLCSRAEGCPQCFVFTGKGLRES
jgi:hypothetical protein